MQTTNEADLFSWAKSNKAVVKKRARREPRPTGFARALALVVEYGRRAEGIQPPVAPRPAIACCPRCGHTGPIDRDFGTRRVNGEVRAQSWCRNCRAETTRARAVRRDVQMLELDFGKAA